jgi:hypothetical protein
MQANRADAAPALRARRRATKVPSRGAAVVQTDSKGEGRRCAHDLDGRTAAPSTRQFAVRAHSLPHLLSLSSAAVACDSLSTCATVPGHCYPRHWRDYRLQCTAECAVCIHSVLFSRVSQSRRLTAARFRKVVRAAAHLRPQPIALAMRNHSKLILVRSEQWCCRVSIDAAYPMRITSGSIRAS